MKILGIDPGLSITGWGIVSSLGNKSLTLVKYGCIKTKASTPLAERLYQIYINLYKIIQSDTPDFIAIEELFFAKEAKTIAAVSQARGVILLVAAQNEIPVFEYNPRQVKIALTGYGSADKNQIQHMVKTLLSLQDIPKPDDASDAIAIAICHINSQSPVYKQILDKGI